MLEKNQGVKHDSDKPRWCLLPWNAVGEIVKVLTVGAKKYEDDNWKRVDNAKSRYFSAHLRHLTAWENGEIDDPETGLNHLAHAGCCLLFLLWFDLRGGNENGIYCKSLYCRRCRRKCQKTIKGS